jgi:hypothetical protein
LLIPVENTLQKAHLSTMWNENADLIRTNQHILITSVDPIKSGGRVDRIHVTERLRADRLYCAYCLLRSVLSDESSTGEPNFGIHSIFRFTVFFDPRSVVAHAARCAWCVACICCKCTVKSVAFGVDPELIVTAGRTDEATVSTTLGAVIIGSGDGRTVHETTWIFGSLDFWKRTP